MKKLLLILVLLTNLISSETVFSQHRMKENIGSQPIWGPVGYDYVEYYYFPDIQVYYHVKKNRFIYFNGNEWKISRVLPAKNIGFNLFDSKIVVINQPKPYLHNNGYSNKYLLTNSFEKQQIIRDSHELKYMINKNHPDHLMWLEITGNERRNGAVTM